MTLALQGTPPTACSEHELVAAVRRGDDRAFEVLFSRYEKRITAYVAGMVGDHARAEDIRQDVFISALRRMRATQREIAFKPWIYEIAKNACIDEFRRARRAAEVVFEERDGSTVGAPTAFVHAPAPDAAIESKQRLNDLCGAFGGLSESHHRVLVLREFEGLSYREIGERLGMTRAMVESTLFRARRRLTEEYDELASGRRCARVQSLIAAGDERPLTSLGVRERRQLARHIAHCGPCRHQARAGGVDESLLAPRRRMARIAALLPLPLLRWRRGPARDDAITQSGSHSIAVAQSLQNVARLADPSGPATAFGRAAAAAAAIALAGATAGAGIGTHSAGSRAQTVRRATAAPSGSAHSSAVAPVVPGTVGLARTGAPSAAPAHGVQLPLGSSSSPAAPGSPPPSNVSTPAQSTTGSAPATGSTQTAGGSGTPAGAPSVAAAAGATNGGNVSVPTVGNSAPTAPPSAPQLPAPSSALPTEGASQVPTAPSGQGAQAMVPPAAHSTLGTATSAVNQTAGQVTQSLPPPPDASPPSGG